MPAGFALCVGVTLSTVLLFALETNDPYFIVASTSTLTYLHQAQVGELWWFDQGGDYWLPAAQFAHCREQAERLAGYFHGLAYMKEKSDV